MMTRTEKWLVTIIVFLCALLTLFVVEHIWLVYDYQRTINEPLTAPPCATAAKTPTGTKP